MVINNKNIIIRPENPSEYEEVNEIIYEAFAEQHGIETGKFMMEHFMKERQKETFVPEAQPRITVDDLRFICIGNTFLKKENEI